MSDGLDSVFAGSSDENSLLIAETILAKKPGSDAVVSTLVGCSTVGFGATFFGVPKPLIAGCCASARSSLRGSYNLASGFSTRL